MGSLGMQASMGVSGAMWIHFYDPHYEEIRVGLYALELTTEQWDTRRFQGLIIEGLARRGGLCSARLSTFFLWPRRMRRWLSFRKRYSY